MTWVTIPMYKCHVLSKHTYIEIPWVVPLRVLTWLSARGLLNCFRTLACSIACSMDAWAAPNEQDAEETLKCQKYIKQRSFFNNPLLHRKNWP